MGEEFGPWHDELADGASGSGPEAGRVRIELTGPQKVVYDSDSRFRVLVAGRRFGKTYLAIPELLRMAWGQDRESWYVAPTYRQAKRIAWRVLKRIAAPYIVDKNESDLSITLSCGGRIALRGAENYDSLRGVGLDGLVIDEYADIAPEAWTEALRPMLADRRGRALFIGTPEGYNHFYEMWSAAHAQPDWAAWQYTTLQGGNVHPDEVAAARREMDDKVFRQEFEASFESLYAGRTYYAFDRTHNVRPVQFDKALPVVWSLDFNVNPMASVICQAVGREVRVLQEIILPNSNTPEACRVFRERIQPMLDQLRDKWALHPLAVHVYGDAAGNQRKSSADRTDWQIVKAAFAGESLLPATFFAGVANPTVKGRVNAMNAMLRNAEGERRLIVDPSCKELIADLEQVTWKTDAAGNPTGDLDKSNQKRTHVSDALGYFVEKEFGLRQKGGERSAFVA